jgi:hypothetical protein
MPALAPVTWYVATTGNDSNDCLTMATPCATINSAIGKAASGDTILIAKGTYFSNNLSGYPRFQIYNKPLTLSGGWNDSFSSQSGISTLDGKKDIGTVLYIAYNANNVTIDHLLMQNGGRGISVEDSTDVTISQSSVYGNSNWGIANWGGNITVENSTISSNLSAGIYQYSGATNIINSTITGNSSNGSGTGISGNSISIQNSIIASNNIIGNGSDCSGNITSLGNNIIGTTYGCGITTQPSDLVGENPQVSTFLGSGYHALFPVSPAIDAANATACPDSDQRGVSRPVGTNCDIGAYEYTVPGSAARIRVQTGSYQLAGPNTSLSIPPEALVLDNLGSPVAGVLVSFLSPASGASGTFADTGTNHTTATTDANGIASASAFTTNSTPGVFEITASINGVSETARFSITSTALYVSPSGNDSLNCLTPATACSSINGALYKSPANAKIFIGEGVYTGTQYSYEVVNVNKSIFLSGGWNNAFTEQNKQSIIDGQASRNGMYIATGNIVTIDHFIIKNTGDGIKNYLGTVTLLNSSLLNNQNGVNNQGTMTATNITLIQSSSYGIANHHTLTIQNSTIAGNAGGIYSGSYTLAVNCNDIGYT